MFATLQVAVFSVAAKTTLQSPLLLVAAGVVLPFALWNVLIGAATFLQHTSPSIAWFVDPDQWSAAEPQLHNVVNARIPQWLDTLLHHMMEHTAHHLDESIPSYHLARAQALVERQTDGVHVQTLTLAGVRDVARRCKLYDFDAHRWLDFEGRATAEVFARVGPARARLSKTSSRLNLAHALLFLISQDHA